MNAERKAAMAEGRRASRIVAAYLEALDASASTRRPGRPRSRERAAARVDVIRDQLRAEGSALRRLALTQEMADLKAFLDADGPDNAAELALLRQQFIEVAYGYGKRKGISHAAWREVGVPAAVLREAGIER
jgi:signal transduction protein with GAF and PtsI domain